MTQEGFQSGDPHSNRERIPGIVRGTFKSATAYTDLQRENQAIGMKNLRPIPRVLLLFGFKFQGIIPCPNGGGFFMHLHGKLLLPVKHLK